MHQSVARRNQSGDAGYSCRHRDEDSGTRTVARPGRSGAFPKAAASWMLSHTVSLPCDPSSCAPKVRRGHVACARKLRIAIPYSRVGWRGNLVPLPPHVDDTRFLRDGSEAHPISLPPLAEKNQRPVHIHRCPPWGCTGCSALERGTNPSPSGPSGTPSRNRYASTSAAPGSRQSRPGPLQRQINRSWRPRESMP